MDHESCKSAPALELCKRLLHALDGGIHLILDHHPVAGQGGGAPLQVLHRAIDVGGWGGGADVAHSTGVTQTFAPSSRFNAAGRLEVSDLSSWLPIRAH